MAGRRILMISSEVESFARTGGLGDVVFALSRALADLGADVIVVTPLYGTTKVPAAATWWSSPVEARVGWGAHDVRPLGVLEAILPPHVKPRAGGSARVCLLANNELYFRGGTGGIY